MRKNTYILQTIQDELTLSSDMKSTLNFGLEKCIYKKYLNFDIFHHSPTLRIIKFLRHQEKLSAIDLYRHDGQVSHCYVPNDQSSLWWNCAVGMAKEFHDAILLWESRIQLKTCLSLFNVIFLWKILFSVKPNIWYSVYLLIRWKIILSLDIVIMVVLSWAMSS